MTRLEPDPETLFTEVEPLIRRGDGILSLDDSTRDHLYAMKIRLVRRHRSGKHKRVVWGINLINMVWTDGDRTLPVDYRVYDKPTDGLGKNDHSRAMVLAAQRRGFSPRAVLFDGWYASLENLELIRDCDWVFLTLSKINRKVDVGRQGYRPLAEVAFDGPSVVVHLEGFGSVRAFRVVSRDGDTEYRATNDLGMDELRRLELAEKSWAIEKDQTDCTSSNRWCAAPVVQYGPRLLGLAADLKPRLGVSYRKCSSVLLTLTGLVVASAALARSGHRLRKLAQPSYDRLVEAASQNAVQHFDETGWKIGGRLAWLWVFADEHARLYRIRKSRAHGVVVEVLGEAFAGVLVSDCYLAYDPLPFAKQKCLAHLLKTCREIEAAKTRGAVRFSRRVAALLRRAMALKRRRRMIGDHGYAVLRGKIHAELDRLLAGTYGAATSSAIPSDRPPPARSLLFILKRRLVDRKDLRRARIRLDTDPGRCG